MKYVFDIDGTICTQTDGRYEDAVPIKDRIKKINELYDAGNEIVFMTARGMGRNNGDHVLAYRDFYVLTHGQLEEWGVKFHNLILGKPVADLFVDDKGINDERFFYK